MNGRKLFAWTLLVGAALLGCGAGCAHYPVNPPLARYDRAAGYRFANCDSQGGDADATLIVLAFSGGGTRAAAFSYGVLEELRKTPLPGAAGRTVLDEVDVISSVSGGSFTAAYYGLYRDRIFDDPEFRDRFLYHNVEFDLLLSVLNPLNVVRLASPTFSRIDLAAEYYDQRLYHHDTFARLAAMRRRPFVILNSTDMSLGARFEFTQNQFDLLYSDLGPVPVARGVAASSAFPFLLAPLTLNNYPKDAPLREPIWVTTAYANDFENSPRRWRRAADVRSYFDPTRRFVHLMDGGIADNVGLRGPTQSTQFPDTLYLEDGTRPVVSGDFNVQRMHSADDSKVRRIVFIIADAKPGDGHGRDASDATPGVLDVGLTTATAPMGNYSFETVQALREYCALIEKEHGGAGMTKLKTYLIHLRFDGIRDPATRAALQALGTNYNLPATAVDSLRASAGQLLRESPDFRKLLSDLAANP